MKTMLVNWVYYRPVGHALEGLKVANGYFQANSELEVSILLNSEMPAELGDLCPWIKKVYPADVTELALKGPEAGCLKQIPVEWDYVVSDDRLVHSVSSYTPELLNANRIITDHFKARVWKGCRQPAINGAPPYRKDSVMRFQLPGAVRQAASEYAHQGLKICILPAGSNADNIYPEPEWWVKLMDSITEAFGDVHFYITGATSRQGNRSQSYLLSAEDIGYITGSRANITSCFDIGIVNQVALLEYCDLLISPHSGFAFLAGCVDTPWLALSGARWPEYFFNHVAFYSVLPDCKLYPCYTGMKQGCKDNISKGKPVECMQQVNLSNKIPEIIDGIKTLTGGSFTYSDSIAMYRKNVITGGYPLSNFWTFDLSFDIKG